MRTVRPGSAWKRPRGRDAICSEHYGRCSPAARNPRRLAPKPRCRRHRPESDRNLLPWPASSARSLWPIIRARDRCQSHGWRQIFAIATVKSPSPQQRSVASVPGCRPSSASTLLGSGQRTSHQSASGIAVPGNGPAVMSDLRSRNRQERCRPALRSSQAMLRRHRSAFIDAAQSALSPSRRSRSRCRSSRTAPDPPHSFRSHQTGTWSDGFSLPRGLLSIPQSTSRASACGESRR